LRPSPQPSNFSFYKVFSYQINSNYIDMMQ
jgi:hypothetical protein